MKASDNPAALGPQDLVISTLKATGVAACHGPKAAAGRGHAVIFAQNGIPWWYDIGLPADHPAPPDLFFPRSRRRLARAIPKERIIGGVIYSSNEVIAARRGGKPLARAQHAADRRVRRSRGRAHRRLRAVLEAAQIASAPWRRSGKRSGRSCSPTCRCRCCACSPARPRARCATSRRCRT